MDAISALTFDVKEDGWEQSKGFIVRQIPMPSLDEVQNPNDAASVIVRMKYAGVCGSDRGIWNRASFKDLIHQSLAKEQKTVRILGHEFLGEIVAMGSMVKELYDGSNLANVAPLEAGTVVTGDSHVTCGKCYQCKAGQNNVCSNESILGISIDGVFAEYVKIPARNLWPISLEKVRPEIGAIYDPLGNAIHALSKVDVRGQTVAVFGTGPIGLFSITFLKHFGAANVIAADINPDNLVLAKTLGADAAIAITQGNKANSYDADPDAVAAIMKITGGRGVDIAIEMAGPASSVNNCLENARRGGQVILFGLKDGNFVIPRFSRAIVKGLTLHGVIGRRIFETWQVLDSVIADRSNGVQEKIWNVILKEGKGAIIPFAEYDRETFGKLMDEYPKLVFKF